MSGRLHTLQMLIEQLSNLKGKAVVEPYAGGQRRCEHNFVTPRIFDIVFRLAS